MLFTIFVVSVTVLLVMVVMLAGIVLSLKNLCYREKSTPFECGFDNNSSNRVPFSLRFFLITIIFLIFDVEVVILLPSVSSCWSSPILPWWEVSVFFVLVLLGGLFHEWNQGALKWSL